MAVRLPQTHFSDLAPLVAAGTDIADSLDMEGGVRSNLLGFSNSLRLRLGDRKRLGVALLGNVILLVWALLDKQDFLGHVHFLARAGKDRQGCI